MTKLVESLADVRGSCMKYITLSQLDLCHTEHIPLEQLLSLSLTMCTLVALATVEVIFHTHPFPQ